MNILFVCTGNTCRSPMAAKILEKRAKDANLDIKVKSAGIAAVEGSEASENAKIIMRDFGSDEHKTMRVSEELLSWADLILTMTNQHKQILLIHAPQYANKIFSLKEYIVSKSESKEDITEEFNDYPDIVDPFGGDLEVYRQTAKEIDLAVQKMIEILKK
ncbi:hypothetical protein BHF71_01325 [Vulcanibacillus modesticaldus]|uniref:Phosphotyrosine protein phosphatase I domain-containing protein n=1 Tax=Vulcanibacillus modesticaldus TaxID=337097 RepID=A0A1D2YVU7_9BACI|nr:low molecular weight protein arginine phosphatase [Vulcanibacillus modesticaldus]OEF99844.1 hypothetical protein BHF71_01325 [Vulcanibacillus modesticaldus]